MNKLLFASLLTLSLGAAAPSAFADHKAGHKGKGHKCACAEGCEHKGKGKKCEKCACKGEECAKGGSCEHGHEHSEKEAAPAPKTQ